MTFVPVVIVAIAAAFPPLRTPALVALSAGFAVAWRLRQPEAAAWAGTIPVAVSLGFGLIPHPPGATDGSTCASPVAPFATVRLVEAVERAGSDWQSDRRLALALERMGHVDWALDVLTRWSRRGPGEAHALRLFVDYGRLDLASERLFTTRNGSATMASARAMWHLAHDDAGRVVLAV